jgi:hypothetical protein
MRTILFFLCVLVLTACTAAGEKDVRREIEVANRCVSDTDCTVVQSTCPFDCYALVHKDEAERIDALIQAFPSTCTYSCVPQPTFRCIEGLCRFDY